MAKVIGYDRTPFIFYAPYHLFGGRNPLEANQLCEQDKTCLSDSIDCEL